MENLITTNTYTTRERFELRPHQIMVEDARLLRPIDLLQDEDNNGRKLLSRADLILIFTLYPNGITEFLDEYLEYVENEVVEKGYKAVNKPHYYLKNIID